MIIPIKLFDPNTLELLDIAETPFFRIERAINLLIQEHNDLIRAIALKLMPEEIVEVGGKDTKLKDALTPGISGPECVNAVREKLRELVTFMHDPNKE